MDIGLTTPHLEAFAVTRGSAAAMFSVLDRVPDIDSLSKTGKRLPGLRVISILRKFISSILQDLKLR
jgi:hypothetical protein